MFFFLFSQIYEIICSSKFARYRDHRFIHFFEIFVNKNETDSIDDDVIMIEMKTLIKNESRENQKSVILIVNDDNDDNESKTFDQLQTLSAFIKINIENWSLIAISRVLISTILNYDLLIRVRESWIFLNWYLYY